MLKSVRDHVWAFDCEWVPDPQAGRLLYALPDATPDRRAVEVMWLQGGATAETPAPFLKTILCRVVSIAAVCRRRVRGNEVKLDLLWLPRDPSDDCQRSEKNVIGTFLQAVGRHQPQLIGFNSKGADLKILVQRAVAAGLSAPDFCRRPEKPWEGVDYFARDNESHIDLMEILGGWGEKRGVSLNEMATLSGIPGKFGADGEQVAGLWLDGKITEIVRYNCHDALTTYLIWLRLAHFAGQFDAPQYEEEQHRVRDLLMALAEKPETAFLETYFDEWERLQRATGQV